MRKSVTVHGLLPYAVGFDPFKVTNKNSPKYLRRIRKKNGNGKSLLITFEIRDEIGKQHCYLCLSTSTKVFIYLLFVVIYIDSIYENRNVPNFNEFHQKIKIFR